MGEAWTALLGSLFGLWDEDRVVLQDLGRTLGMTDSSYQHDHVTATLHELDRLLEDARHQWNHDGRLYPALLSALGVAVVILMV